MEESTDGGIRVESASVVLDIAPELLRMHLLESGSETGRKRQPKKERKGRCCGICGLHCPTPSEYRTHRRTHGEDARTCADCGKVFTTRKYMQRHYRTMHSDHQLPVQCDFCDKRFRYHSKKLLHERTHTREKPYKCEVCGKSYAVPYTYKMHMLIHTDEKPYRCRYCPYACRDTSTRRKHEARHRGESVLFRCRLCDVAYKKKVTLKAHIAECHTKRPFRLPCDKCDATFRTPATLTHHVKAVHERALSVACPVCRMRLTDRNNLRQHLLRHTAASLRCAAADCGKRFTTKQDLAKHERVHRPPEHWCACGRGFRRAHRLRRHRLVCAGAPPPRAPRVPRATRATCAPRATRSTSAPRGAWHCDVCGRCLRTRNALIGHLRGEHREVYTHRCDPACRAHHVTSHGDVKSHSVTSQGETSHQRDGSASPSFSAVDIKEELIDVDEHSLEDMLQKAEVVHLHDINNATMETEHRVTPQKLLNDILSEKGPVEISSAKLIDDDDDDDDKQEVNEDEYIIVTQIKRDMDPDELKRIEEIDKNMIKVVKDHKYKKEDLNKDNFKPVKSRRKTKMEEDVLFKIDSKTLCKDRISLRTDRPARRSKAEWLSHKDLTDAEFERLLQSAEMTPIQPKKTQPTVEKIIIKKGNKKKFYIKQDTKKSAENKKQMVQRKKLKEKLENLNTIDYSGTESTRTITSKYIGKCKIKFNTEQCYVCLKLFSSREELNKHCQTHYDVCNERSLKKCPLCSFVTSNSISRHMRLKHKVTLSAEFAHVTRDIPKNVTYKARVKKKVFNEPVQDFESIDVIPSVNHLNRMSSMKIDKQRKAAKSKAIFDSRLVKKGKEWIVEQERVELDLKDYVIPNFDVKNGDYLDALKDLHYQLKRAGKKMIFPCDKCEKRCRSLAAIKAHRKSHEPKIKVKQNVRTAANKKLKEFFKNNVSAEFEFTQFKKIYRNINKNKSVKKVKKTKVKHIRDIFTRKILLSRDEYMKRLRIKKILRQKIKSLKANTLSIEN